MSTNDDISANDIPDILAGTTGTEQAAYQNDPNAVLAALQEDPNLLSEITQPGFVEVVNELAGDAAPTLGTPETVAQAYQDANNESMSDAFTDLQQNQAELNPQPFPPGPSSETEQLIESQLAQIESELNPTSSAGGAADTGYQEYSNLEGSPFETAQASPFETAGGGEYGTAQASPFETAQAEPMSYEEPAGFNPPEYET